MGLSKAHLKVYTLPSQPFVLFVLYLTLGSSASQHKSRCSVLDLLVWQVAAVLICEVQVYKHKSSVLHLNSRSVSSSSKVPGRFGISKTLAQTGAVTSARCNCATARSC